MKPRIFKHYIDEYRQWVLDCDDMVGYFQTWQLAVDYALQWCAHYGWRD